MTLREALAAASTALPSANARRDAELLLAHILHQPRTYLLAHPEAELTPTQLAAFQQLITRRAAHEPLQHLTGQQEFHGLTLRVTPDVLIPRPETEHLVEAVLAWAATQPQPLRIADIGTGSGAIAIAIATHLPTAQIIATDISPAALAIAHENAATHHLTNIHFLHADLLPPAEPAFDAIISNPPYIPLTDAPTLQPEVRDHEPHTALFAGDDGLDIYRRLIPQALTHLRPDGLLALEIGHGQQPALTHLLAGWQNVAFLNDYAQIPRIALATRP